MPLTPFQRGVAQILAKHRNPESHVAGGVVINRGEGGVRISDDLGPGGYDVAVSGGEAKVTYHPPQGAPDIPLFEGALRDGRILDCNDALVEYLGYSSRAELLSRESWDLYPQRSDRQAFLDSLTREHALKNLRLHFKKKDGTD